MLLLLLLLLLLYPALVIPLQCKHSPSPVHYRYCCLTAAALLALVLPLAAAGCCNAREQPAAAAHPRRVPQGLEPAV
jgi:hypothetical protein